MTKTADPIFERAAFGDFTSGARVAAIDFTGDGRAEVVVGAGEGGGPRVRVIDLVSGALIGEYRLELTTGANKKLAKTVKVKEDHPHPDFPWSEAKESKAVFNLPEEDFTDGTKVKLVIKTIHGDVPFGEFDVE